MGKLEGKIALITGGTSGIGAASAIIMAKEGAKVIAVGRNKAHGDELNSKSSLLGLNIDIQYFDIADKKQIESLYEYVVNTYGQLHILFNNAGILLTGALEEITDEDWDTSFNVNVKALMHMCQKFMPLVEAAEGVVLNNASNIGLQYYIKGKRSYMYASTKASMIQFSQHLAKNYAPHVRVNTICPGVTSTNIFTNRDFSRFKDVNLLGRVADSAEIANTVLFLVSDDSSFMTGSIIVVDGGESIK